jgi:hypothetical protein
MQHLRTDPGQLSRVSHSVPMWSPSAKLNAGRKYIALLVNDVERPHLANAQLPCRPSTEHTRSQDHRSWPINCVMSQHQTPEEYESQLPTRALHAVCGTACCMRQAPVAASCRTRQSPCLHNHECNADYVLAPARSIATGESPNVPSSAIRQMATEAATGAARSHDAASSMPKRLHSSFHTGELCSSVRPTCRSPHARHGLRLPQSHQRLVNSESNNRSQAGCARLVWPAWRRLAVASMSLYLTHA